MWICVFTILLGYVGLLGICKASPSDSGTNIDTKALKVAVGDHEGGEFSSSNIRLSGYRNNVFGTAMNWGLLALGVVWLGYLLALSADFYGSVPGIAPGAACVLSLGDCTLGNQTFIVMWCLYVFMVVTCNVFRHRLRNFFRIKTAPAEGTFVCVERKIDSQIMLQNERSFLVDNHITAHGRKYFTYQCTRFVLDQTTGEYTPYTFDLGATNSDLVANSPGLSTAEAEYRMELVGQNFIEVSVPNWFFAFLREVTSFIALYQLLALLLFIYDFYWQAGIVDLGIVLLAMTFSTVVRKLSEERLKRMAEQDDQVNVRRNGDWVQASSRDLVPGDVIQLTTGMHMSCDCILISGNAVVNESSLTGEPLPVRKFPLHNDDTPFNVEANKKQPAAQAIEKSAGDILADQHVLGLVHRTGTASDKGKLVRKILFPQPLSFIFNEQLKVVFSILIVYALFCMGMAIYLYKGSPTAVFFYGNFCMLQAVSPLLPAGLVAGQSMAAYRLKKKRIFCVDPQRIMMAGKVQIFCFDKTGTLTKEGLEFYGGQCVDGNAFQGFENALPNTSILFQQAVASCHAVTDLNGQLIGNPVDIEQFPPKYLDTIIPAGGSSLGKLHVVRRFEFVHARASDGSFERIKQVSNSASVPLDYDRTCAGLAREGCYVLSIAHKQLDVTLEGLKDLTQDEIEGNCDLIGLLVFKNLLKNDTSDAIAELKHGSTRTVMVTGDTALTGVYIARQCGMVPANSKVLLGDMDKKTHMLVWTDVDTDEEVADIGPLLTELGSDGYPTTELALTSAAFQHLESTSGLAEILLNTRIFARMKPNDKVRCVQQHMVHGITAMCGDGGNDCGALRAAHVGLALSDAEASIVSPFSSSNRSVHSCVELLLQGRAGLASSFSNYRALILYGTTMTMTKLPIWMIIDALVATSMAITVTFLPPAKRPLAVPPYGTDIGPEIMSSVIGVVVINWPWFPGATSFDASNTNVLKWWAAGRTTYEAAMMTYLIMYMFINNGFLVNYGYVHRKPWFHQPKLDSGVAGLIIMISYAQLAPPSRLSCWSGWDMGGPGWEIEKYNAVDGHNILPSDFKWKLLWLFTGQCAHGSAGSARCGRLKLKL
ncbi:HAD-like protein [Linderina pennispora]|uniref:HAD-like protein n=1 Tax=Linderina pennispora TaxID=61395 RepID=A0A1Y1VQS1_9FUNG|nr:HAD-like protein [Linderina pennispora]ORX63639.1 HAD-like protein [Linderina pennispora]